MFLCFFFSSFVRAAEECNVAMMLCVSHDVIVINGVAVFVSLL